MCSGLLCLRIPRALMTFRDLAFNKSLHTTCAHRRSSFILLQLISLIFNRTKPAHHVLYFYLCILSFRSIFNQTLIVKYQAFAWLCMCDCSSVFSFCCWMDSLCSLHSIHCKIVLSAYLLIRFAAIRYLNIIQNCTEQFV